MKNAIIFIISILLFLSCKKNSKELPDLSGYKLNSTIQKYVDSLAIIGYVNAEEKYNRRYKDLIKAASINDLIFLTNYKVPEIRCYAFNVLVDKKYPKIKDIFYKHHKDSAFVKTLTSSAPIQETVARFMLDKVKFRFEKKEFHRNEMIVKQIEHNVRPKPGPRLDDSIKKMQHYDLVYYEEYYWSDSNDPEFKEKRKLVDEPIHFVRFDNNILVTAYFDVNGYNSHFPNIERKGDTIILKDQMLKKGYFDKEFRCIEKINFYISDQYMPERQAKVVIKEKKPATNSTYPQWLDFLGLTLVFHV